MRMFNTNKEWILHLLDEQVVSYETVARMCLAYLSEQDIADILKENELDEESVLS